MRELSLCYRCEQYVRYECRGSVISGGYFYGGDGKKFLFEKTKAFTASELKTENCSCLLDRACSSLKPGK